MSIFPRDFTLRAGILLIVAVVIAVVVTGAFSLVLSTTG